MTFNTDITTALLDYTILTSGNPTTQTLLTVPGGSTQLSEWSVTADTEGEVCEITGFELYFKDNSGSVTYNQYYLGCYMEDSGDRDIDTYKSATDSTETCVGRAENNDKRYLGMSRSRRCYIGDSFGKHGKRPESQCDQSC